MVVRQYPMSAAAREHLSDFWRPNKTKYQIFNKILEEKTSAKPTWYISFKTLVELSYSIFSCWRNFSPRGENYPKKVTKILKFFGDFWDFIFRFLRFSLRFLKIALKNETKIFSSYLPLDSPRVNEFLEILILVFHHEPMCFPGGHPKALVPGLGREIKSISINLSINWMINQSISQS